MKSTGRKGKIIDKYGINCLVALVHTKNVQEINTVSIIENYYFKVPCGFSREFNFADCRLFTFRGNKFSRIWISDFTAGSKLSQVPVRYFTYGIYNIVSSQFN